MARIPKYLVDGERNRIEFLDSRFYLHDNGKWYPSSTTVLEAYPKTAQFYEWLKRMGDQADEIRDAAGDSGSVVHNLTERYDNGDTVCMADEIGKAKYSTVEWAMFERYVDFCKRFSPEIIHTELNLVSDKLEYGGTLDRILNLDGMKLLVDIKTGNAIHKHFWLQLVSYLDLYEEAYKEKLDGVAILWLNAKTRTEGKKGQYQGKGYQLMFPEKDLEHYRKLFKGTYANWIEENEDYKPRNLVYSLTHKK